MFVEKLLQIGSLLEQDSIALIPYSSPRTWGTIYGIKDPKYLYGLYGFNQCF